MNRLFQFTLLSLFCVLITCCGNNKEEAFKDYISPDRSFSVSVPASLDKDPRSRSDFMAFTKENVFIFVTKQSEASLDEDAIKVNPPGDKFVFDLVEETDSTKLYKYSQGLLVIYEYYLIKKLQCGNFLITIKDNVSSKDNIVSTGLKIYSSLKDYTKVQNADAAEESRSSSLEETYSTRYYSVKYPKGWQIMEHMDEMTEVYIGYQPENFGFTIVRFETDYSLSELNAEGNENLRQAGFKILENKQMTIIGEKGYRTVLEITIQGQKVKHISYSFKKGDMLYNVKFGSVTTKAQEKLAAEIIKSFHFK